MRYTGILKSCSLLPFEPEDVVPQINIWYTLRGFSFWNDPTSQPLRSRLCINPLNPIQGVSFLSKGWQELCGLI
jgi:hypothetical protein